MIDLTRRNFLLGAGAAGLLVLQPPALRFAEVRELIVRKPELVTSLIKGVALGEVTRVATPGPNDILLEGFTLEAHAELLDVTSLDSQWCIRVAGCVEYTIEAWIRGEDLSCLGKTMQLSLKAGPNTFYEGSFYITEQSLDLGMEEHERLGLLGRA